MKIFAFIFPLYILFLTVEPGIKAMVSESTKSECCGGTCKPITEKDSQTPKPGNKNNSNKSGCNPFEICKVCIGYTVNFCSSYSFLKLSFGEQPSPSNDKIPSNLSLDFWQPPKIV